MPTDDAISHEAAEQEAARQSIPGPKSTALAQWLAGVACAVFGICLIANTQLANDGGWYWYAVLHHGGKRLYADMGMVLQPGMVLETEGWLMLAGKSWLASKVPALAHLILFVVGLALVNARNRLNDVSKAIILGCAFFVGIRFEAYRFDDYHVLFHIFFLFSIVLLLKIDSGERERWNLWMAAGLGVLSGLAVMTRLTDGAALLGSVLLAIPCLARARRTWLLAAFGAAASLTLAGVVGLTGDTFASYASHSIFRAAGAKGGAGNVLLRPLALPWNSLTFFELPQLLVVFKCAAAVASWMFLAHTFSGGNLRASAMKVAAGIGVLVASVSWLLPEIKWGGLVHVLAALWILGAYCWAVFAIVRVIQAASKGERQALPERKQILLLLPFSLMLTGAMSSGGVHWGLYSPVAFLILLLPVVFPAAFEARWLRSGFLATALLMMAAGASFKFLDPVSWNNHWTFAMFSKRLVVRHPVYGPMVIDKDLHGFAEGMCSIINAEGRSELLSTPFPYVNYYCDIPPWQGFVQTFFDTAGKDSIDDLITKLRQSPPQWVLYERQLGNLAGHEAIFAGGKRLPYRDLDEFIMSKASSGQWKTVKTQRYGSWTLWILLKTR